MRTGDIRLYEILSLHRFGINDHGVLCCDGLFRKHLIEGDEIAIDHQNVVMFLTPEAAEEFAVKVLHLSVLDYHITRVI